MIELDVVKLPTNPQFFKSSTSLTINLHPSNLPSGAYDRIVIRCIDVENEQEDKNGTCNRSSNICTCNGLVGGTKYKIEFITIKENFTDEKLEIPTTQYTSNILLICY